MTICLWCSWRVVLQFKRPHPAPLPPHAGETTPHPSCGGIWRPQDSVDTPSGPEYAKKLQNHLESAHSFTKEQQQSAGVRQKQNYDVKAQGRHFLPRELVLIYSPWRRKGRCHKLDSQWVGPYRVLEQLGEVVSECLRVKRVCVAESWERHHVFSVREAK